MHHMLQKVYSPESALFEWLTAIFAVESGPKWAVPVKR